MSRNKTQKFRDNEQRDNVVQEGKEWFENIKGNWRQYFKNDRPLVLELACGRGEYSVGLARENPGTNYVGIDIKGDRLWKGSGIAIDEQLSNVAFLRTDLRVLDKFFEVDEVDEIWLTHPDPRPRKRDVKRRLTHPRFMELYKSILKHDGWFRFKTDNTGLFDFTLEMISSGQIKVKNLEKTYDLYTSDLISEHYGIITRYEKKFTDAGETIKYMKFQFDEPLRDQ